MASGSLGNLAKPYVGPFVTSDPGDALFLGYDGDPNGEFKSVSASSEWAGLGAKARNEVFTVHCAITALAGDPDVLAAVDRVYAIHTAFEAAVRADPDLNQAPPFTAAVAGGELFTMAHPAGLQVLLAFGVQVTTRI